ncbi:MerR family transcriptional regulator [Cohnella sp. REN36]|uniref:MerR family transcriptional regulator n=1 Tax=Cohnella sp. REN36 TaxID=2887347 RepID=UPI001D14C14B|nr:MerR family transcriptional regulator [Cohnella sp. REN36]MCC3377139.1 MerR family transcriptional regulator [Cohnella sp. REN36]
MQIRDVAARLGITTRTVRFYEQKGLIRPAKDRENGYRRFTEQEVWRLQTIVALREAGLGLAETAAALARLEADEGDELIGLLELQRSAMYARWLEWKQQIETTERLIALLRDTGSLAADELTALAEGSRRLREARSGWVDRWDYDGRAASHEAETLSAAPAEGAERIRRHYEEALARLSGRIRPRPGERGIDLGAGTGNLAGRLQALGARMAAVDQSREMLKRCAARHPDIETRQGNFVSVPYPDAQFDFAVSSFAFRHLDEAQQALALSEQRRVLKPGGRLAFADLTAACGKQREAGAPVSLESLRKALSAQGFAYEIERVGDGVSLIYAETVS